MEKDENELEAPPPNNSVLFTMIADVGNDSERKYERLSERVDRLERHIKGESFFDSPEKMAGLMLVAYLASMLLPSLIDRLSKVGE